MILLLLFIDLQDGLLICTVDPRFVIKNQFWKQFCTLAWYFLGQWRAYRYLSVKKVHVGIGPIEIKLSIALQNGPFFHQKLIFHRILAIVLVMVLVARIPRARHWQMCLLVVEVVDEGQSVVQFYSFDRAGPLNVLRELEVGQAVRTDKHVIVFVTAGGGGGQI